MRMSLTDESENQSGSLPQGRRAMPCDLALVIIGTLLAVLALGPVWYCSRDASQDGIYQRVGHERDQDVPEHSRSITSYYYRYEARKPHKLNHDVAVACILSLARTSPRSSVCFASSVDQAAPSLAPSPQRSEQPVEDATRSFKYVNTQCIFESPGKFDACDNASEAFSNGALSQVRQRVPAAPRDYQATADDGSRSPYTETQMNLFRNLARNMGLLHIQTNSKPLAFMSAARSENCGVAEVSWTGSFDRDNEMYSSRDAKRTNGVLFLALAANAFLFALLAFPAEAKEFSGSDKTGGRILEGQNISKLHRPSKVIMRFNEKVKPGQLRRRFMFPLISSVFLLSAGAVLLLIQTMEATQDLRENIIRGNEPCFHYAMEKSLFRMNCSVLDWHTQGYGSNTFISLGANEIFEVPNKDSYIDLSGVVDFEGLIKIRNEEVMSFAEAPLIRNVHVRNGNVASGGGFIVQKEQKYFKVDSCSSTGDIFVWKGGGICGAQCGRYHGEITISNSYSTGDLNAGHAGGIAGQGAGYEGGILHITQCYSTGDMLEWSAGGICGDDAGGKSGQVYIKRSYSTGDILAGADHSGGIVGADAGWDNGYVQIQECYSTGKISADNSGGISGSSLARAEGEVHIIDCFTRGDIEGQWAGGITGSDTGGEDYSDVYINNTYASGSVKHADAGGIIGSISNAFQGHIHVQYSVYNSTGEENIIGQDDGTHLDETDNSNDLSNIRGRLYKYDGEERWTNDTWVVNGADSVPIFRYQLLEKPSPSPSSTSTSRPTRTASASRTATPTPTTKAIRDLRESIIQGTEPCFQYIFEKGLFLMNCSVLDWQAQGYGSDTYISLGANEIFDGHSTVNSIAPYIDLSGTIDFEGLFKINEVEVSTFAEAPLIKNVHVRNGQVASLGGFIVQKEQKYFIIDSCSSTGDIFGTHAGGICGYKCGQPNGQIKMSNSFSTGKIMGNLAGGIAGAEIGYPGGIIEITQCYSTGSIEGYATGGICGNRAGQMGQLYIKQSYSTGNIAPDSGTSYSGGIVSQQAGMNGYVQIRECYSTGQISAGYSGGISGSRPAELRGEVHIINCYTRGDIEGKWAGGITGWDTGGYGSLDNDFGDVYINNSYAAGIVKHTDAGGIVGSIASDFRGRTTHVQYSVYNNGTGEGNIVGEDSSNRLEETGNSNDLTNIRGQLYHYRGVQRWHDDIWVINGTSELPILVFQLQPSPTPNPSLTSTTSPTRTPSASRSQTPTSTWTASSSATGTPTPSSRNSATSSPMETPTTTMKRAATSSSSSSSLSSWTTTSTPTVTQSKSPQVLKSYVILPLQFPPRSVRQHSSSAKRGRRRQH